MNIYAPGKAGAGVSGRELKVNLNPGRTSAIKGIYEV